MKPVWVIYRKLAKNRGRSWKIDLARPVFADEKTALEECEFATTWSPMFSFKAVRYIPNPVA